mgnify:CR=1 FL=1
MLENGLTMYLWLGQNVDSSLVKNLFGVTSLQQLNVEKCKILDIDTPISKTLRTIINMIQEQRKLSMKVIIYFIIVNFLQTKVFNSFNFLIKKAFNRSTT